MATWLNSLFVAILTAVVKHSARKRSREGHRRIHNRGNQVADRQYQFRGDVTSFNFRLPATILATAALAFSFGAWAQSPPAFEVASIRRNLSAGPNTNINISGGRLTVTNASLKTLIRNAYEILGFQLAGEPRWLDTEMYDIVATTGASGKISPDQFKLLLQNLLADRFQLKVHWETRETSVYELLLDKNGPRFKDNSDGQEPGINTSKRSGKGTMKGTREPISILASNLGNQLSRIVVDKTGLQGVYDWTLEWSLDMTDDATHPTLFTALQEQLGLRLKASKGPMETLVIDSANRPSEN